MEDIFSLIDSIFNDSDNVCTSFKSLTAYNSTLLFFFAPPVAIIMTFN